MTGKQTASLLLACTGILLCAGCDGQQAETAPDFATVSLVTTENASASAVSAADERMEAGGLLIEGDDNSYTGTFNAVRRPDQPVSRGQRGRLAGRRGGSVSLAGRGSYPLL